MSLPTELIEHVSENLAFRELTVLAMVNSELCAIAQRLLYSEVHVTGQSLSVLATLASKPHVARYVRVFRIVIGPYTTFPDAHHRTLNISLSHMAQLTSLHLSLPPPTNPFTVLPSNTSISFPRLRTFHTSLSLSMATIVFIGCMPELVDLGLGQDMALSTHQAAVPLPIASQLQEFHGTAQAAHAIIPGRPVHSVQLLSDLDASIVEALAKSSVPLVKLDLVATRLPIPVIRAISIHMPHLIELRVLTLYDIWGQFFRPGYLLTLQRILSNMDQLLSANVSGLVWRWRNVGGERLIELEPSLCDADAEPTFESL